MEQVAKALTNIADALNNVSSSLDDVAVAIRDKELDTEKVADAIRDAMRVYLREGKS